MNKIELLKRTGVVEQYAGITPFCYTDGKASGVNAYRVKTGSGLEFTVLRDRALDLFEATYKGVNLAFMSRNGLVSPKFYTPAKGFGSVMSGGMMFTAGLRNTGKAGTVDGNYYPTHGSMHSTPASDSYAKSTWESEDRLHFEIGGRMHDGTFTRALILNRKIETQMDSNEIAITDIVENPECFEQDFAILYHINMGYPFVDDCTEVIIDAPHEVYPRGEWSAANINNHKQFEAPDTKDERNYRFDIEADSEGWTTARAENKKLGLGIYVKAKKDTLPYTNEWKSVFPGLYTLAIEPLNNTLHGIEYEKQNGTMRTIKPYETIEHKVKIGVYEL